MKLRLIKFSPVPTYIVIIEQLHNFQVVVSDSQGKQRVIIVRLIRGDVVVEQLANGCQIIVLDGSHQVEFTCEIGCFCSIEICHVDVCYVAASLPDRCGRKK